MIATIHNKEEYEYAVSLLDRLIDRIGDDEEHPLASLMETIGERIAAHENQHVPEPQGDAIGCLKFLMAEHNLEQRELRELGSKGVLSEVLSGKRKLILSQI